MVVALGRASQHHAVRMEGRRRDGRTLRLVEEAIVWLNARELGAIKVVYIDCVVGRAAVGPMLACIFSHA